MAARIDSSAGGEAPLPAAWRSYQQRVDEWLMACFGKAIACDREERNHRFIEEALELVQANGCTASEAHQLVDYVYGRPVGDLRQEVGGVMNTLAALCLACGVDLADEAERELARVWTKVDAIRAKQAAKPKHSPLPEHVGTRPTSNAVESLAEACERWSFSTGGPPDYDSPLNGVFVAGMLYSEKLLCALLGVERYEGGDGSEDFDTDATTSLRNILTAAKLHDPEDGSWAKLATPDAGDVEASSSAAWQNVIAERRRQVAVKGWTPEHDDSHATGEMVRAAFCYALGTPTSHRGGEKAPLQWPWSPRWWKPTSRRRNLVKAGALILAEIERLDRATARSTPQPAAAPAREDR